MDNFSPRGMGIALVTPFNQDKSIDFKSLGNLIDRNIAAGVDYLVVLGTTGEAATLSAAERIQIAEFVKERNAGRVPLVLGLGGNCTQSLVEEIKAAALDGFSAILSVAPFYNKPSQEGLFLHFSAVAEASPLPIILYNVPGRTGVNISAETTLRLARAHRNIIGIKEASGDIAQVEAIIKGKPEEFHVISGDDALALPYICIGAEGVISVVGNAYPASFEILVKEALAGNLDAARTHQHRFDAIYRYLFIDGNPSGIKCLLHAMGLIKNELRLPLSPCTSNTEQLIRCAMEVMGDD